MATDNYVTLDHLPAELLYDIYLLALSPSLPLTSKYLHAVFKAAPPSLHAEYIIRCYNAAAAHSTSARLFGFISKALRYPICTREVLEAILRNPECPEMPPPNDPSAPVTILPRHLFRNLTPRDAPGQRPWTEYDEPLPFLKFLYSDPRIPYPSSNSFEGYALTRAVYAGFTPLVRFLLEQDASPACKGGLAVTVAIRRKSLPLVRMLIERDGPGPADVTPKHGSKKLKRFSGGEDGGERGATSGPSGQTSNGTNSGAKRRKLGDRISVTPDMLRAAVKCDAHDIAEYLMREKGCVPDMQTVLMMGR
ncbi:hypothetical protein PYCCODRAFT_1397404 [Trametes coccinea BRFM310]|uniref:Uncharacterized protein n=1 Tax=Trametes coccinea (strain BRFM310) TaxID=1353009 RepID=A0A1Y2IEF2_TRAC3|nr:hypothetical protein PYCCODRAFT_1397404 [Trametes coccinea BRFM310]